MTLINPHLSHQTDPRCTPPVRAAGFFVGNVTPRRERLCALILAASTCLASCAVAQQTTPPEFSAISQAVQQYFDSLEDFQPGDLITRSRVNAVLDDVRDIGWQVPNRPEIVERALPDNAFLVSELSTPAGRIFMRRISKESGTYQRLDRLASIGRGKAIVRDLVKDKDGDKFIEYLATTKSGKNLGHMLGEARQGADLNRPTGRIYTAADLLNVLNAEHAKAFP